MSKVPVTVYTKSNCSQCDMTKKMLTKGGIEYTEVNLEENLDKLEEFKARGLLAAPIVTTDVKEWSGFQHGKITSLIGYVKSAQRGDF